MEQAILAALVAGAGGIAAKLLDVALKHARLNSHKPALPAPRTSTPDLVQLAWDERAEAREREDHFHSAYFEKCAELERCCEERDQALREATALLHKAAELEALQLSLDQLQHALAGAHETIASLNGLSVEQAQTIAELRATLARIGDYGG